MHEKTTADNSFVAVQEQLRGKSEAGWALAPRTGKRIRIVHIINSLDIGGAELALLRLVLAFDRSIFETQIVSLLREGVLGARLRDAGFGVTCLKLSKKGFNLTAVPRLVRLLAAEKPDIVQTWLQQSDLVGGIAAKLARVPHVFWNIRHGTLHPTFTSRRTHFVTRMCAIMAHRVPERVVCCSESSLTEQVRLGYPADKMLVIPNGVDTIRFSPDSRSYREVREELQISDDVVLFGAAGRLHPQKDYPNLIHAAGQIAKRRPECQFVFCGEGITMDNPDIRSMVNSTGVPERFHLLGRRDDIPRFMAALDIFLSAARFGEGFPNVISEAMACGVPCIVTDIGDSALIVGRTGLVVPFERPAVLVEAALTLTELGHDNLRKLGQEARRRVSDCFSMSRMVESYQQLYAETVERCG